MQQTCVADRELRPDARRRVQSSDERLRQHLAPDHLVEHRRSPPQRETTRRRVGADERQHRVETRHRHGRPPPLAFHCRRPQMPSRRLRFVALARTQHIDSAEPIEAINADQAYRLKNGHRVICSPADHRALWLGYLDSNQEQLRVAWPARTNPRIGGAPRNFRDLMELSLARATDSHAVNRAGSCHSGGFLVTNLVTDSRRRRAAGPARTRRAVGDLW